MVNTRRTESSGLATENGPRYQTRKSNDNAPVLGSSCESDSGGQGGEEEESADEENWWSPKQHTKVSTQLPSVRELRNRFVHERNFSEKLNLIKRELRSSRKRLSVNERRHKLTVYSSHKMHDDLESEEDSYSPRHHSRRSRFSKSHLSRLERRTALSLRPITRKSYKDQSPVTCNSEDSDSIQVRRSTRKRNSDNKNINMSWLTDDQMHKVGYPNMRRYSDDEEDSRDAEDTRRENIRRSERDTKKKRYMFSYENEDIHSTHNQRNHEKNLRSNSRAESHDKENKEDNIMNGGRINGKLKPKETDAKKDEESDAKNDIEDEEEKEKEKCEETTENPENDEEDEEKEAEKEDENKEDEESSSDELAKQGLRRKRNCLRNNGYNKRAGRKRKTLHSSSSSEVGRKGYSLRDRAPKQSARDLRSRPVHVRRMFRRKMSTDSSSDSSTDSDEMCKYNKNTKSPHSKTKNEQLRSGGSKVIPIGPDTLDPKITFNSVGGLDSHVQCLKEMILLPMMYPEIYQQFQIQPPRGVLFHGPPGTGKTLLARALANECSFGTRKVTFFMRKGADLLSKWIGESEKQLRLLFEQASEKKPSIIFFDEVDGLAPVRSSRQDQIHASIVSTLLAMMDGLDNRGEVIVIGATNRIDSIDPALRRPGRFDRELFFPLPAQKEREEILKVHISQWSTPPSEQLISYLAESAGGYCGSDLRALCSEAVIQSVRRTYPQLYNSNHKLLVDPNTVKVQKLDFLRAKSILVPASHRVTQSIGRKLLPVLEPLLSKPLQDVLKILERSFPHGLDPNLAKVKISASVRPAQLLLLGNGYTHGQTSHLAPAIIQRMEHINAHILDLASLHKHGGTSPEEACIQALHEAKRNVPSILYIPNIDLLWNLVSETVFAIFIAQIIQLDPNRPILILATADSLYEDLPEQIGRLFSKYRNEIYEITVPNSETRKQFFKPLLIDACLKPPRPLRYDSKTPPPLPKAPTPPPPPITKEAANRMFEQEERTMRELRIFLRDMCKKLASNRLFFMFTKPVDTEEVPDYPTIIKQPMDLETMMTKVDFHKYECAKDFLVDIELICQNALEYNPARTSADKQIRHRACALRDYAFTLIKSEMDSDFEDKCQEISKKRKQRKVVVKEYLPPYLEASADHKIDTVEPKLEEPVKTAPPATLNGASSTRVSPNRKRKIPSWQKGYLKRRKRRDRPSNIEIQIGTESKLSQENGEKMSSGDDSKENITEVNENISSMTDFTDDINEDTSMKLPQANAKVTAPLTVNCDTSSENLNKKSNKRRLSDLLSPSELLDDPLDFDDVDQAINETILEGSVQIEKVNISKDDLETVLQNAVTVTSEHSLQSLLDLHFQFSRIVKKYIRTSNRTSLPKELKEELKRFYNEQMINDVTTSC